MEKIINIIVPIITFFLGYFGEKILDKIGAKIKEKRIKIQVNKTRKKMSTNAIDIIYTETIHPSISQNNIEVKKSDKRLFLAFPESLKSAAVQIEGEFAEKDESFCEFKFENYTSEEISSAIETAREEIAENFIKRECGLYDNGDKIGIVRLDSKTRSRNSQKTPKLLIETYQTDYFSHHVITRALQLLKPDKSYITEESLNSNLVWARTSFGVSVIVVLESTNEILLTHRAPSAAFTDGNSWIYVSATEPLSKKDLEAEEYMSALAHCVKRGLEEELGIEKNMYLFDNIEFHDCFFETNFFQDGIVASVKLSKEISPQQILTKRAMDKQLEIQDIFFIDNTADAIRKFIKQHRKEMRSQTIFALETYASSL